MGTVISWAQAVPRAGLQRGQASSPGLGLCTRQSQGALSVRQLETQLTHSQHRCSVQNPRLDEVTQRVNVGSVVQSLSCGQLFATP